MRVRGARWLAAAVVAAAGAAGCGDDGGQEFALPAPGGGLEIEKKGGGWRIELDADLPRLDGGSYYEASLEGPDGSLPLGSFNEADDVVLWAGGSPVDFPTFVVVAQPSGDEVFRVALDE